MIRAGGDALVDVLLVVRLVDPVLELEELRVGERRDLCFFCFLSDLPFIPLLLCIT